MGQLVEDRSRWLSNGTEPPLAVFSKSTVRSTGPQTGPGALDFLVPKYTEILGNLPPSRDLT